MSAKTFHWTRLSTPIFKITWFCQTNKTEVQHKRLEIRERNAQNPPIESQCYYLLFSQLLTVFYSDIHTLNYSNVFDETLSTIKHMINSIFRCGKLTGQKSNFWRFGSVFQKSIPSRPTVLHTCLASRHTMVQSNPHLCYYVINSPIAGTQYDKQKSNMHI